MPIGAHITTSNIIKSINEIKKLGGSVISIMAQKQSEPYKIKEHLLLTNTTLIVHSSYTINIADPYSINILQTEINNSYDMGAQAIVVHMGKQLNLIKPIAINNMFYTLISIKSPIIILLETSAGQGTELCYTIEDLANFYNKLIKHNLHHNIKICIDTCHVYAAGYDLNNFITMFDSLVGIKHIGLLHLNDSKYKKGSHIDRHESIGKGYIGESVLLKIYKQFKHLNVILETPNQSYKKEIKILK